MSVADDFTRELTALDSLFQRVSTDAGVFFCGVRKFSDSSVMLTLTNVSRVWTAELGMSQFKMHKDKLCMPRLSWKQLFVMVASAFHSEHLLSVESGEEGLEELVTLSLTYRLPQDIQLCGELILFEMHDRIEKDEELRVLFSSMMTEMHNRTPRVSAAQSVPEVQAAQDEIKTLKAKVTSLETDLMLARMGLGGDNAGAPASGLGDDFAAGPEELSQPSRRKAPAKDRSLCNPQQKRRQRKKVKIGAA